MKHRGHGPLHLTNIRTPLETQSGTTLINILISLLMIGLGLFAGIQLQIRGIEGVQTSSNQTEALLLAEDMLERMRANSSQLAAYETANLTALPVGQSASYQDCGVVACTAADLVQYDLGSWQERFPAALVSMSANISPDPTDDSMWFVVIRWDDDRNGSTGTNCPPVVLKSDIPSQTDLDCVRMEASF